jgi:hypothetical protein
MTFMFSDRHSRRDRRARAERLCADRDRPGAADSPDQHSGDGAFGQSGAQHRPGALRRGRLGHPAGLGVLGRTARRRGMRGNRLSLAGQASAAAPSASRARRRRATFPSRRAERAAPRTDLTPADRPRANSRPTSARRARRPAQERRRAPAPADAALVDGAAASIRGAPSLRRGRSLRTAGAPSFRRRRPPRTAHRHAARPLPRPASLPTASPVCVPRP